MAAERSDPAFLRDDDSDRLADHHRLFDRGLVVLRCLAKSGAALAELGLRAELFAQLLDLAADRLPLLRHRAKERLHLRALSLELLVFGLDLHLLETAQIAQPH